MKTIKFPKPQPVTLTIDLSMFDGKLNRAVAMVKIAEYVEKLAGRPQRIARAA